MPSPILYPPSSISCVNGGLLHHLFWGLSVRLFEFQDFVVRLVVRLVVVRLVVVRLVVVVVLLLLAFLLMLMLVLVPPFPSR